MADSQITLILDLNIIKLQTKYKFYPFIETDNPSIPEGPTCIVTDSMAYIEMNQEVSRLTLTLREADKSRILSFSY